ncbi:Dolichyldiphosphatase 1 [Coemansia javaensis]|uniref:Dolichyldiphosphatase n=1 Tax=Coemansia javaensis TaxID=2761396 RepID=A0A9W8LM90_9FUNG|nr:Dolichyldiphosphatase 1 [Coemansia javaensis]
MDGAQRQLRPFGLTYFQYEDGDHVGMLLALASLAPIFLVVAETAVVLSRREAAGILLLAGQLLNEALNLALKLWIREDRPHQHLGDGYGMPSSHAQFMGFFAVYMALYFERQVAALAAHRRLVLAGAAVLAALVAASRVYLGYHTAAQVLAGVAAGVASGAAWYAFVERVVRGGGILDAALATRPCRWLLIRDSRGIRDIARAEYDLSMAARRKQA